MTHIVLIPGFAGFDALGQLEYYAGVTPLFQHRRGRVLHYFDNFPTAAVVTRAGRLQRYLAKRIARGGIADGDEVTLVGHSTGGLDIRRLIWDLHARKQPIVVDGGATVEPEAILDGSASVGVDWVNIGSFDASRPNIIGPIAAGRSLPDNYVNPAAFGYPLDAAGQRIHVEGNAGRNTIEQPGINNWDLGVFKNTAVHERLNVQLRWEMFNAWNHTQYGPANLSMTSASVGRITSTLVGPRRMQFGLRLRF